MNGTPMNKFLVPLCLVTLSTAAAAQTGRTMNLLAPAVLGHTAIFSMSHPVAAAGNIYALLFSPPFAGTAPVVVPGLLVIGVARIDQTNFFAPYAGVLNGSGSVSHSLAVPNFAGFLGNAWDLQSVDLDVAATRLYLADNDLPLSISGAIPTDMVPIAAGTFQMGSPVTPLGVAPYYNQASAQPVHQVTITRPFWMGKYEVTQAEYQAVMSSNPSYFQGAAYPNSPTRPVEQVSWNYAMAYCTALTTREAAAGRLPSGYQYRLPTEAEWEYCCRAGTTTEFHYGPTLVCGQANFGYIYHTNSVCGSTQTAVVGVYAPNAWGLHDMHGNVWEWCLDAWNGTANYPAYPVTDPFVPGSVSGPIRVLRGGGWRNVSYGCRSAYRDGVNPGYGDYNLGFRVVLASVLVP